MSRIRPTWTPANTDQSGDFTIGHRWSATAAVTVQGAWYFRGTGTNPPTALTAVLYDFLTESPLASGSVGPPAEGWSLVSFATPFDALDGVDYVTAVETNGRYGFDLDGVEDPITDPDHGLVTIPGGGAAFEFGHVYPGSFWSGMHGTDTEFTPADADPHQGSAVLMVGADLAVAGSRVSAGSTPLAVGAGLAAVGSRRSAAAAPLRVGAQLAAAGWRAAAGAAPLAVGVQLAAAGWRTAPGRPVAPFPAGHSVTPFPAGRPVRSFSEVPS